MTDNSRRVIVDNIRRSLTPATSFSVDPTGVADGTCWECPRTVSRFRPPNVSADGRLRGTRIGLSPRRVGGRRGQGRSGEAGAQLPLRASPSHGTICSSPSSSDVSRRPHLQWPAMLGDGRAASARRSRASAFLLTEIRLVCVMHGGSAALSWVTLMESRKFTHRLWRIVRDRSA